MKPVVLILSTVRDRHAQAVKEELQRHQIDALIFNPADFFGASLTASLKTTWCGQLQIADAPLELERISSIWYRRPKPLQADPTLPPHLQTFFEDKARIGLGGIFRSLDILWVNHPEREYTAEYKPLQLQQAVRAGPTIPRTLITTNPGQVQQFYEECGRSIIYKPLRSGALTTEQGEIISIYTSRVMTEHVAQAAHDPILPKLLQEYVPKAFELRINVIGHEAIATQIHSQESERTAVDWRRDYQALTYAPYTLPSSVETALLRLVRAFELEFAAIDMIVRPDGEHVFLEVNPNGQWYWLVQAGVPLVQILSRFLAGGKQNRHHNQRKDFLSV